MPRIRTLKPESLQHRKVGRLSDRAFRLWIGMLTQADDQGRLVADLEQLRVLIFGYHPKVLTRHVATARDELCGVGLIRVYRSGGADYADFPSWKDHQSIDRAKASKLPPYEASSIDRDESREIEADQGSRIKDQGRDQGPRIDAALAVRAVDGFHAFWQAYPRKQAKEEARRAWAKVNPDAELQAQILEAVACQVSGADWTREGGRFIPYPASWLNGKRWTDQGTEGRPVVPGEPVFKRFLERHGEGRA